MSLVAHLLLLSTAATGLGDNPVPISRVFALGEKNTYAVRSALQVEASSKELKTAIPEDLGLQYNFTTEVT
ncbi:MAG: hypothetical protein ACOYON_13865, partial [Fimbriimonas sp.]